MQASPRVRANHALEYAVHLAQHRSAALEVFFVLTAGFPGATRRHYRFLLQGIQDVAQGLRKRGIPFSLHCGDVPAVATELCRGASTLVTDCGYLRIQRQWREQVARNAAIPVVQVESNVVVPLATASDKDQWAAATLRPRIHRHLPEFLKPLEEQRYNGSAESREFPSAVPVPRDAAAVEALLDNLQLADPVPEASSTEFFGGATAAQHHLQQFLQNKLRDYHTRRSDPAADHTSLLSPYLHFGHISPLDIVLQARDWAERELEPEHRDGLDSFIEELVVRRELAMNFAHYNDDYDRWEGVPPWARTSLLEHSGDDRPALYTPAQLERGETGDPYWNACQRQMVRTGHMHGYMRMYWGKKILEWMQDPPDAFALACELNDRYELDGRDPNGYAGVAWCFGKHDRPWVERPVFGKIRYMNANGLRRKFRGIDDYVGRWAPD